MAGIENKNFPRVAPLSQFVKVDSKTIGSSVTKWLKPLVARRDVILGEDIVAINIASCVSNRILDKSKLIKMLRECYDISENLTFYGWNGLMLKLNIQYGSKECSDTSAKIFNFILKHIEAYQEILGKPIRNIVKPFPKELAELRADHLLCKDDSGESCYTKMWVLIDDAYYIYDCFLDELVNFGYTKDQIKVIIHSRNTTGGYDYIPNYLIKKYLAIPDGSKSIRDIFGGYFNEDSCRE